MKNLTDPYGSPVAVNLKKALYVVEERNEDEVNTGNSIVFFPGEVWIKVQGSPHEILLDS